MRSQRCRQRRLMRLPALSVSARFWPMPPENGLPRIGRSAQLVRLRPHIGWGRRSPMPGDMGYSRSSGLPARMIWMHRTSLSLLQKPKKVSTKTIGNGGQQTRSDRRAGRANANNSGSTSRQAELSAVLSASLRADLLREVEGLNSVDDAAVWAQRRLAAKNALSAADAEHVEQAFESKLATVMHELGDEARSPYEHDKRLSRRKRIRQRSQVAINKTLLALPAPRRVRDREHVKSVAKQPCLICGRSPSDAHHLRFAQSRALGRKVSDEFTVPLCRGHHREVHRCGDESAWWDKVDIDPTVTARALWLKTHPLPPTPNNAENP